MADIVKLATSIPAFAGVFPVAVGTHLSLEQPWSARNTSARKQRAFEASVELTERGFRTYAKVHFDRGRFRVGVIPLKRNRHQPPRYFELYDRSVPKTVWAFRSDMHKAWPAAPQMPALSNMTDPRPEFIPSVAAMLEPPLSSWLRVGRGKAAGFDCLLFEQTTGSPISGS